MKDFRVLFLICSLFFIIQLYPQSIWSISKPNLNIMKQIKLDTAITYLQEIIRNPFSEYWPYEYAAKYLAYFHKDEQKDFLLHNLNTTPDSTQDPIEYFYNLQKYFTDALIRGFLGDSTAISMMEDIVRSDLHFSEAERIRAIYALAQAGILASDYFEIAKTHNAIHVLQYYESDSTYAQDLQNYYVNSVENLNNENKALYILKHRLPKLNKDKAIEIFWDKIEDSEGVERQLLFYHLSNIDSVNAVSNVKRVLQLEEDEYYRSLYFPDIRLVYMGIFSPDFLCFEFVNFLNEYKVNESSVSILNMIDRFLIDFYPKEPDSTLNLTMLAEELNKTIDSVYAYNWLGDSAYKNKLKKEVEGVKKDILQNDYPAVNENVQQFIDSVYFVFRDSTNSGTDFITREGWNFLYWKAQYILDKIP